MVQTFDTIDELFLDAGAELLKEGVSPSNSRDGEVFGELTGYTARLADPTANMLFNPIRKWSPHYAAAEMLWFLSGEVSIHRILPYAPQYKRFSNPMMVPVTEDGRETFPELGARLEMRDAAPGAAYGWRWSRLVGDETQMNTIIRMLKATPETRQAVICHWDTPYDLLNAAKGSLNTIPCTVCLNFLVRDGHLNMSAYMRSNDLWLGLPYDIFSFTCLQQFVAAICGFKLGWYQHHAMSLHVYSRNSGKFRESMYPPKFDVPDGPFEWLHGNTTHSAYFHETVSQALKLEEHHRRLGCISRGTDEALRPGSLIRELVIMAGLKWAKPRDNYIKLLYNPTLKKYAEKFYREEN